MPVPEPYNLTLIGNNTGYVDLMLKVNTVLMNDFLGILILIMVFGVLLLTLIGLTQKGNVSFLASSWITFLISLILKNLGIIPDIALYMCLTLAVISIAFIKQDD